MMFSDVTYLQERNVSDVYGGEDRHELKIVDAIYEGNSARSRALQLADVCCSTIRLHLLKTAIAEPFYKLIRIQIFNGDEQPYFS
ncbi:MAG: hypothetical protein ACLQBA_09115 [Candidatus Binataceae bacterium]